MSTNIWMSEIESCVKADIGIGRYDDIKGILMTATFFDSLIRTKIISSFEIEEFMNVQIKYAFVQIFGKYYKVYTLPEYCYIIRKMYRILGCDPINESDSDTEKELKQYAICCTVDRRGELILPCK